MSEVGLTHSLRKASSFNLTEDCHTLILSETGHPLKPCYLLGKTKATGVYMVLMAAKQSMGKEAVNLRGSKEGHMGGVWREEREGRNDVIISRSQSEI